MMKIIMVINNNYEEDSYYASEEDGNSEVDYDNSNENYNDN